MLTTPGHWVIGALINNVWSVAGSGSRPPVNQMLLQWFVNYNLKKGWYVATSPIVTADLRASSAYRLQVAGNLLQRFYLQNQKNGRALRTHDAARTRGLAADREAAR